MSLLNDRLRCKRDVHGDAAIRTISADLAFNGFDRSSLLVGRWAGVVADFCAFGSMRPLPRPISRLPRPRAFLAVEPPFRAGIVIKSASSPYEIST